MASIEARSHENPSERGEIQGPHRICRISLGSVADRTAWPKGARHKREAVPESVAARVENGGTNRKLVAYIVAGLISEQRMLAAADVEAIEAVPGRPVL